MTTAQAMNLKIGELVEITKAEAAGFDIEPDIGEVIYNDRAIVIIRWSDGHEGDFPVAFLGHITKRVILPMGVIVDSHLFN